MSVHVHIHDAWSPQARAAALAARKAGHSAGVAGVHPSKSPHAKGTRLHGHWMAGHRAGSAVREQVKSIAARGQAQRAGIVHAHHAVGAAVNKAAEWHGILSAGYQR